MEAREAIFFARLSGRGKIVRKMINERAAIATQNLYSRGLCFRVKYTTGNEGIMRRKNFYFKIDGTRFMQIS